MRSVLLAVVACSVLSGCAAPAVAAAEPPPSPGSVLEQLASLPTRPDVAVPGYERDAFGDGWTDTDHDCRNTRNEVLARDMVVTSFSRDSCRVLTGRLADRYTGRTIEFVAGPKTSDDVQIDHRWPLAASWRAGANQWTPERRERFANDEANLTAVDGPTNQAKGDRLTWLPPNAAYRCEYVARVVGIGAEYGLAVTSSERAGMARVLGGCPEQEVPR